jgi:hypothetical protein
MKLPISKSIIALALLMGWTAQAGISYGTFANSGNIPDGSSSGSAGTATASGFLPTISDISVKLNISGGFNGDLYAYLSYGGVLVPLLNRVGVTTTGGGDAFGYGETGFNVTLSSAGAQDVHFYGNYSPTINGSGQLTGTWQPDGRAIDPQSAPSSFDSASRVSFGSYSGLNPNGTWTLFLADLSAGGGQSQLVSWELDITAVPEPVNVALGVIAGVFLLVILARSRLVRNRVHRWHAAFVEWVNAV